MEKSSTMMDVESSAVDVDENSSGCISSPELWRGMKSPTKNYLW